MSKTAAGKSRLSTIKRGAKAEKAAKKHASQASYKSSSKYRKTIIDRITKIPENRRKNCVSFG